MADTLVRINNYTSIYGTCMLHFQQLSCVDRNPTLASFQAPPPPITNKATETSA